METEGGHRRTPLTMYAPACLLVALGIWMGAAPGLGQKAQRSASQFENRIEYRAAVFIAPAPPAPPQPSAGPVTYPIDIAEGFATLGAGILFALLVLFSGAVRKAAAGMARIMAPIRALHNGHVGDYTAWLTFGVVLFGAVLAASFL
ncbi:MAG TPA: hypothetical protein VFW83_05545, partial [Bryobacteraceae bacterium]|nr:hypothetical protein [Bryobacteraceae bacterium]